MLSNHKPYLEVQHLSKFFEEKDKQHWVLKDISFSLDKGQSLSLTGPSGSGKSTLLHLIGLLDQASSGEVLYNQTAISTWNTKQKNQFRSNSLGFVFQKHMLLPELSLLENVMLPLAKNQGWSTKSKEQARYWLNKMGLSHRQSSKPKNTSGGEQQRAAICRAVVNNPELVLMDEPTGNLDPVQGQEMISSLLNLFEEDGISSIIVTHNLEISNLTNCHCTLEDHQLHFTSE